jgi:hypothetical protein
MIKEAFLKCFHWDTSYYRNLLTKICSQIANIRTHWCENCTRTRNFEDITVKYLCIFSSIYICGNEFWLSRISSLQLYIQNRPLKCSIICYYIFSLYSILILINWHVFMYCSKLDSNQIKNINNNDTYRMRKLCHDIRVTYKKSFGRNAFCENYPWKV